MVQIRGKTGYPVLVVLRAKSMDAEGLSSGAVLGAVVDEEGFVSGGLLSTEHHLENVRRRLHDLALVAQVEVVEIVVDGMVAAVEGRCASPLHHEGVCIRQQTDLVALLAQLEQHVEIALGNALHIAVPGIKALVHCQIASNDTAQFHTELLTGNPATFEVTKDAMLVEGVEVLTGITQSDFLELPNGILVTQGKHYAAKVESDVMDSRMH